MNNKFDELAQGLVQSTTRRLALKRFGGGLAGMALACFGLANRAEAAPNVGCLPGGYACQKDSDCCSGDCLRPTGPNKFGFPKIRYCAY
jgi:hypothetical protein